MINPFKYLVNRNVGLVLGSGGAKGMVHIAVIEYLETLGIPINMIAGSSIGALIAALYCCGKLNEFKKDMLNISRKELFSLFDPVFPRSGFIEGKNWAKFIRNYIPKDAMIEDLDIPLSILATDYISGKSVIFTHGNILEAIRASVSVPGIFVPVRYKSTFLIDGGVANPLPVNIAKKMGAGITIAVNLHPSLKKRELKSYFKSTLLGTDMAIDSRDIKFVDDKRNIPKQNKENNMNWFKSVEHYLGFSADKRSKAPGIFEVISQSFDIMEYMNTLLRLKYCPPTVLIEPDLLHYDTLQFDKTEEILLEGYNACTKVRNTLVRKVKIRV